MPPNVNNTKPHGMILKAPGTNCENETKDALELAGATAEVTYLTDLDSGEAELAIASTQLLVIAGGFSYGDDIKAGRVMSIELETRFGDQVQRFVNAGGFILGICNGNQVLVDSGLLPYGDIDRRQEDMTLTNNTNGHFVSRWVDMKTGPNSNSLWVPENFEDRFTLHAAHGEGKYKFSEGVYERLVQNGQIAFLYVDEDGNPTEEQPNNPNGSPHGVAGISDESGRITGLMPHPERNQDEVTHPDFHRARFDPSTVTTLAGLAIVETGVQNLKAA